MPVTFKVAEHPENPLPPRSRPCKHVTDLLMRTWGKRSEKTVAKSQMLQSSLVNPDFESIIPEHNGFVNTVTKAYKTHKHLILRPDDVWIAILGQFNFYVNAHSKELRKQFVAHDDKKTLVVLASGDRFSVDFGDMAHQMANLIHENVVDKDLKNWILPDFSTTSHNDTVICSVFMMATLKAYFNYELCLECGIPSVTLEGKKSDWEKLLKRVDKLDSFGKEPKVWASLLRPILKRFVSAFDGKPDVDFWGRVCHYKSFGSGATYLSGWVTAFCVWSSEGKWQGPPLKGHLPAWKPSLLLDDVIYTAVESTDVPPGFCEVDVKLNDNGQIFNCMMVSGHVATQVHDAKRDKVSPFPAWFMFIKDLSEIPEEEGPEKALDGEPSSRVTGSSKAVQEQKSKKSRQIGSKLVKTLWNSRLGRWLSKVFHIPA